MCVAFLADLFQKSRFEETVNIHVSCDKNYLYNLEHYKNNKIKHVVFWDLASTEINYCEYFQNPFRKERHIFI